MKIAIQHLTALFALTLLLGAAPSAFAKGEQLSVTEVAVDFNADTLTITGKDFDHKKLQDLTVSLGEFGDITALCSGPPAPTATLIVCDFFSVGGLPSDGDYLLAVATSNKKNQSDEYDLTIGAVGPQGEQGPAGADGADGTDGAVGPAGVAGVVGPKGDTGPKGEDGAGLTRGDIAPIVIGELYRKRFQCFEGAACDLNDSESRIFVRLYCDEPFDEILAVECTNAWYEAVNEPGTGTSNPVPGFSRYGFCSSFKTNGFWSFIGLLCLRQDGSPQ